MKILKYLFHGEVITQINIQNTVSDICECTFANAALETIGKKTDQRFLMCPIMCIFVIAILSIEDRFA